MTRKDDLKFILRKIFKDYNSNRIIYNGMLEGIKNRMSLGKFAQFYSQSDTDIQVRNEELYWMGKLFKREFDKIEEDLKDSYVEQFDIKNYFTTGEINKAENYTIELEKVVSDILILENVVKINSDEYICYKLSYQDIAKAFNEGVAIYNFETQRNPSTEYSRVLNEMIYKPRIYARTVKEMFETMKNGEFIPNMITWNILSTGAEKFTYNESKKQLTFKRDAGSQINCIDGYHRTLAIDKVVSENPEFDGYMQIKIFNYNVDKAKKFIKQEAKGNKISTKKLEQLEENKYLKMVEQINDYGSKETNLMYHQVSDSKREVFKDKTKYVYKNTLVNALRDNYDKIIEEDFREIANIRSWVISFLNEIVLLKYDILKDINNNTEKRADIYNNMWTFYVAWSRILYKDSNWKEKLSVLVSGVDWTTDNENWSKVSMNSTREDKRVSAKIKQYAEETSASLLEKEM